MYKFLSLDALQILSPKFAKLTQNILDEHTKVNI